VGDDRAETYLRRLAETEVRRVLGALPAFWLRLTPPLSVRPDTIEMVVTGQATRVGALVPVREAHGMADT
jgi:hypothetical protein